MAEGWARHLKSDVLTPYSAGTRPGLLDQRAVQVMSELGVDISHARPKQVGELLAIPFDYVITVCDHAKETCPIFPGKTRIIHHGFDDPPFLTQSASSEEEALAVYRRVRDEIRAFVSLLPGSLEHLLSSKF